MDSENYRAALKLLAERYGDTERISRVHYDALMNCNPYSAIMTLQGRGNPIMSWKQITEHCFHLGRSKKCTQIFWFHK